MTGKTVLEHSHSTHFENHMVHNLSTDDIRVVSSEKFYTPIEVATAVTFVVALLQVNVEI